MNDLSEDDFFDCQDKAVKRWFEALRYAEYEYMGLIGEGLKAEEARSVLPNDCKTELVMTGFVSAFSKYASLRRLKILFK